MKERFEKRCASQNRVKDLLSAILWLTGVTVDEGGSAKIYTIAITQEDFENS